MNNIVTNRGKKVKYSELSKYLQGKVCRVYYQFMKSGVNLQLPAGISANILVQKGPDGASELDTIHMGRAMRSVVFWDENGSPHLSYGDPQVLGERFSVGFQGSPTTVAVWLSGVRPEQLRFNTFGGATRNLQEEVPDKGYARPQKRTTAGTDWLKTPYYDRRNSFDVGPVQFAVYSALKPRFERSTL